jgi:hypothetical protein
MTAPTQPTRVRARRGARPGPWWRFALAGATLLLLACGRGEAPRIDQAPLAPEGVISDTLLAALAEAQNLHHTADVQLGHRDMDAAIATLERLVALPFPPGAAEGDAIHADARARLALLLAEVGSLAAAERVVDEGLGAALGESFFVANLHQVRGKLWERRALEAVDPAAQQAAKHQAVLSYERAQQMNFRVQDRLYKELVK